jgi:ATP-binding cassette subfamily B protein
LILHSSPAPHDRSVSAAPAGRSAVGFLLHYALRRPAGHALVLAAVLAAVTCSVAAQYGLKHLIDIVAQGPEAAGAAVWWAFGILCGIIAADNLFWRLGGWAAARSFVAVSGEIREDLFAHLAAQSPGYFADRLPGALAGRISATANAAFTVENTTAWNLLPPAGAVLCALALVATVDTRLALALALLSAALGVLIWRLARRGAPLHRRAASAAAAVDGELVDIIGNTAVMRAFGATLRERRHVGEVVGQDMRARQDSLLHMEKLRLIHATLTVGLAAGALGCGLLLWQHGRITVGDVALLTSLSLTILHGTRDLAVALVELAQQLSRLAEATETLLVPHELTDHPDAVALRPGPGRVQFEAIHFAYPGRPAVLDGFDLCIEPGQRVGLVGFSGAGKSTVLALLQRAQDPDAGRILIDGQDIRLVRQDSLPEALAVVPQDTALFHRSVLENIRYGRPGATEAEVLRAAEVAHCRGFIEALPQGFGTVVGNRGVKLSGGQRQRLAIARALLKDAPILLLDEATSALDSESEKFIQTALDRLMQGRTVIAIAHRLSTLQNFDRIIVMNRGRIVEDGSPADLVLRRGPYRELLRQQHAGTLPDLPEAA